MRMKEKRFINNRMIAVTGLLLAIEIIFQCISMIIPGGINFNLSLIPITMGAILYGPVVGGFLGLMAGVIVLVSPNTIDVFFSVSPIATIFCCLTKTFVAGVLAGLIFNIFKKKNNTLGAILAAVIVPLFNTFIFTIFAYFWFKDALHFTSYSEILYAFIGLNFLIELVTTVIVSPTLYKMVLTRRHSDRLY